MKKNYTVIHLHSDLSNGTTNIDSVTKFEEYIIRAKQEGMKAIAFSEHGNIFNWLKKKETCEKHGLKYIHGTELYMTETLEEKIRDNYHVGLYARNYAGVLELNSLLTKAYDRTDGHFYFVPRITLDELMQTSDNILVTTACIGGLLARGRDDLKEKYINFLSSNKHRCWLELQHHTDQKQIAHNKYCLELSRQYGMNLIVGTDTHALNEIHAKGRTILQKSKNIHFDEEDGWDITWKTYDELMEMFRQQGIFRKEEVEQALENTNVFADMIEEFTMDRSYKYPKMSDNPMQTVKEKAWRGLLDKGIDKYPNYESEYIPRIKEELEVYEHNGAFDFLLLDEDIKSAAAEVGIFPGPSRGSVSGSIIAYLIGMTDMDSIKHKLNFNRFMSKERVSLADVDTDWDPLEREWVKNYLFHKEGLYCSEIITFNTVALKGSIRDVARALEIPLSVVSEICENIETKEAHYRTQYPELFEYVDIINGTIVSVGTHPCGVIVSPIPLNDSIGLFTSSNTDKPVSMLNMKEIDSLNFVKLDVLGLDNIGIINETCRLAGIDRLTPDNVPDEEKVWLSMRDDTTGIFQFESELGSKQLEVSFSDETIEKIKAINPDFKYIDIMSMANGAIRPAGASYRDSLSKGEFRDNGHPALNEFLAPTLGFLVYQEQIIEFLHSFCGYTMGEADIVRRAFAKKTGTEEHIPKIKNGFIKTMEEKFGVHEDEANNIIEAFLIVIKDASEYLFSLNHSQAYSYIGYMCGYLRYYYPLQFLTATLNIVAGNIEKTTKMMEYAKKKGINILRPTYGKSKANYFFDVESNTIYKGIKSVKFLNEQVADELYELSKNHSDLSFIDIIKNCSANSKQIDVLIKIGYFREFGSTKKLLNIVKIHSELDGKKQFKKDKYNPDLIRPFAGTETEKMFKDVDTRALCEHLMSQLSNDEYSLSQLVSYELEFIGDINTIDPSQHNNNCVVIDTNTKYTPVVTLYKLKTGEKVKVKVQKKFWNEKPLEKFDTIYVASASKRNKCRLIDGKWVQQEDFDIYVTYYKI